MLTIHKDRDDITPALRELLGKLSDFSEPMAGIGQELESRISARFETQTDPAGHPWAPWKPSTKENYPADGHNRILDRYGDMLDSLSYQVQPNNNSVRIGFGQPYAVYHEWGSKHMPRRGILITNPDTATLSDVDTQAVMDILQKFLQLS